jgi:hypothetical protein
MQKPPPIDFTAYFFDTALLPPRWNICGVQLRPFCLGHYIILKNIHSPMMSPADETGSEPSAGAKRRDVAEDMAWFFQALIICAATYDDNLAILQDEELHKKTMADFADNLKKNMDIDPHWNIYDKLRDFREYVDWHMTVPFFTEEHQARSAAQNTSPSGTDWVQNIYLIFKKFGYNETEILNMNMRQIFYIWCSEAEMQGSIKVFNRMDVEQLARLKGMI